MNNIPRLRVNFDLEVQTFFVDKWTEKRIMDEIFNNLKCKFPQLSFYMENKDKNVRKF